MSEMVALHFEHAVSRKETQNAAERIGVGTDGCREVGGGQGRIVQRVRDAELGDRVKTPRQAIPARYLYHRCDWICLNHIHSYSSPCLL